MTPTLSMLSAQLALGLVNGAFYALLSIGLAVIFGMLRVVNFAHGAFYTLGAFGAWYLLSYGGFNFWLSLLIVPVVTGLFACIFEWALLRKLYRQNHLHVLLLTFGVALVIEGCFRTLHGTVGLSYPVPPSLRGVIDLGFMVMPTYRLFVLVGSITICAAVWLLIEKSKLGSVLRAATEDPDLVQCLGQNVPLLMTGAFAFAVALAATAGTLAAPIYQVSPLMGADIIILVFAVVIIGGLGSIKGTIVVGYLVGLIEGAAKVIHPQAATVVVFVLMALVLLLRPRGIFGRA